MKFKIKHILFGLAVSVLAVSSIAQNNIIDEVAWVVGDQPIFKSDIEDMYLDSKLNKQDIKGNPYCVLPEQLAIQKLYLNQAKIDTIEVQSSMIVQRVDYMLNSYIEQIGSKEQLENYLHTTIPEYRSKMIEAATDQSKIEQVQRNLTKNVKATPADVRRYFDSLPKDSVPFIPKQVEVQIITINPVIPQQEIDEVKARLREYARQVTSGEMEFSTLAILYSEDPGSSVNGGVVGFRSRAELLPEYANAAFNLKDTKKVSNIVETEDGYHIIQLIEKRGERVNTRHILLRPKVADKDLTDAINHLDTLRNDLLKNKFTFDYAAQQISQDKDSRNNNGFMLNERNNTNRFEMSQLPAEVAKVVDKMKVGDLSEPFVLINQKTNREQVAIVKLSKRIEGHKADLAEDYATIKSMCENSKKEKILEDWILEQQQKTYVFIEDGWRNCEFKYNWLKK